MRRRILVVGHDVAVRARLARALSGAGYAVEVAEGAAQARRVERKGLALAVIAPDGLGRDGAGLTDELRAAIGAAITLADASDEAGLLRLVAEALRPAAEAEDAAPVLRFAGFSLDVAGRSLTDESGKEIPLTQNEFGLLLAFAQRPGRVLSRDQLLQTLAGRDAESFDRAIDMQIVRLRRKIEPNPKSPSLIVTVTGAGYKFAAKVRQAEVIASSKRETAALPEPERPALALPDKPSLAVLPFQNMSGDPEQDYFADGMVEDITSALSRIRWLFVIARNSSFTYKGRAVDIKQVARELGVRYVLEGSVRKAGNRVRVTCQLIDAATGAHLWADRYDRDLGDIFAVQDEITASVAGVIEPALAEAEQHRVLRKPPDRLDAWEAYQRGLWHFHKYDEQDNDAALAFFRQAIALDAKFAPGHYGYALALHWDIWHFSARNLAEVQGAPCAEALIAVSLDDKDAVAHAVLAHIRMWGGEWEAAIAEARTGFALNPNSAFVISMLGCVLCFGGYREEALSRLQQAMRVSPHDPLTWLWQLWRASAQFYGRDFAGALETLREVVRLRPGYFTPHQLIAASLAHLGRVPEARAALDRAGAGFAERHRRYTQQRPPFMRPEYYALRVEGLRLAATAPP